MTVNRGPSLATQNCSFCMSCFSAAEKPHLVNPGNCELSLLLFRRFLRRSVALSSRRSRAKSSHRVKGPFRVHCFVESKEKETLIMIELKDSDLDAVAGGAVIVKDVVDVNNNNIGVNAAAAVAVLGAAAADAQQTQKQ